MTDPRIVTAICVCAVITAAAIIYAWLRHVRTPRLFQEEDTGTQLVRLYDLGDNKYRMEIFAKWSDEPGLTASILEEMIPQSGESQASDDTGKGISPRMYIEFDIPDVLGDAEINTVEMNYSAAGHGRKI